MKTFDQLDWVHAFDDFEMVMYVRMDGDLDDGIYMQVLQKTQEDGAESWNIVYDRRLRAGVEGGLLRAEDPAFEDEVLRAFLHAHPTLVDDEKQYLQEWLANHSDEEEAR